MVVYYSHVLTSKKPNEWKYIFNNEWKTVMKRDFKLRAVLFFIKQYKQ